MVTRLHDGRLLDSSNFHFFDEHRKVTKTEMFGIALAWGVCGPSPQYSIVIAKGEGIVAAALGSRDIAEAASETYRQLACRANPERTERNIVAVVNFPLTFGIARTISVTGVDVLFAPACEGEDISAVEENLKWEWLGKVGHVRGRTMRRALILPRYELLRVKQYKERAHV